MALEYEKNKLEDDVQVLNFNKEKVKDNPIGFEEVKSGKGKQFLKKTAENISKLAVMVAAAVIQIPGIKEAINAFGAMEANGVIGWISKIVGQMKDMPLTNIGGQLIQSDLYNHMSLPKGDYAWVGFLVQFCVNIAVNHPGIVIAGGAALTGFLTSKVVYPIIKKIVRMIKGTYHNRRRIGNANEMQLNIYNDVKMILKHRNFKRVKNHSTFKNCLNDVIRVTEAAKEYPDDLNRLHITLQGIYNLIDKREINDYNQSTINVEAILKGIEARSYNDHVEGLQPQKVR